MAHLCVNIDHIATLRQARRETEPDPVAAAGIVEQAGAEGVTVHLREDRRHIQDRDVDLLRKTVKTKLNLEMAATDEMVAIACRLRPDESTLVPEKREELTTEGGLDVAGHEEKIAAAVKRLKLAGITVSLFIAPDPAQVRAAAGVKADFVELHTGAYAHALQPAEVDRELGLLATAAMQAHSLGLRVNAGHGLTYANVGRVVRIPEVEDLNIGHNIIARAALVGLDRAVREMLAAMKKGTPKEV
ncbi:MAG: pyridoxine 5'-phosphate synthase [candidate division FCPU426 bacterium]